MSKSTPFNGFHSGPDVIRLTVRPAQIANEVENRLIEPF